MIAGIEEKAPPRTAKDRPPAARLSPLETEVIDLFVQFSRLLGLPCKIYNILSVAAPALYIGPRPSHLSEMLDAIGREYPCASVEHGEVDRVIREIERVRRQPFPVSRQTPARVRSPFSKEGLLPRLIAELESD
jgi:hypothetical protein